MKLVFGFTDEIHGKQSENYRVIKTNFEIPDEAAQLPDFRERVLAINQVVAELTNASLRFTCKELQLKEYLVKARSEDKYLDIGFRDTLIYFSRFIGGRSPRRQLKIVCPIASPISYSFPERRKSGRSLQKFLIRPQWMMRYMKGKNPAQEAYYGLIQTIAENILVLLNSGTEKGWDFDGFHPFWLNNAAVKQANKRARTQAAKAIRLAKQQQKLQERLKAKPQQAPQEEPKTGVGRRPGARPGIFMGVQMRSQLEIRFAAELEERKIRWVYESEVLGEGGYLVDFYLLDLGVWVEVKGRFEARDNYLLKEVATYLKRERQQRLLVYTSGKGYVVNASGFREIECKNFWGEVMR